MRSAPAIWSVFTFSFFFSMFFVALSMYTHDLFIMLGHIFPLRWLSTNRMDNILAWPSNVENFEELYGIQIFQRKIQSACILGVSLLVSKFLRQMHIEYARCFWNAFDVLLKLLCTICKSCILSVELYIVLYF